MSKYSKTQVEWAANKSECSVATMYRRLKSGEPLEACIYVRKKLHPSAYYGEPQEARAWKSMISRCYDEKNNSYPNYGGRGIRVCDRWMLSKEAFLVDMGKKPSDLHSLDRIDNDGPYCPENCKWSDRAEQNSNKRDRIENTTTVPAS